MDVSTVPVICRHEVIGRDQGKLGRFCLYENYQECINFENPVSFPRKTWNCCIQFLILFSHFITFFLLVGFQKIYSAISYRLSIRHFAFLSSTFALDCICSLTKAYQAPKRSKSSGSCGAQRHYIPMALILRQKTLYIIIALKNKALPFGHQN